MLALEMMKPPPPSPLPPLSLISCLSVLVDAPRAALDSVWIYVRRLPPDDIMAGERRRRIITTIVWFCTSLVLAIFVPNIGVVISFLGGLAAVFVFIFPG